MQKNSKGDGEFNDTIGPSNLVNTLMIRTRILGVRIFRSISEVIYGFMMTNKSLYFIELYSLSWFDGRVGSTETYFPFPVYTTRQFNIITHTHKHSIV